MKKIRILSLEMENFKGCVHRRLELAGRDLVILGENGCGKTTHYDAVSWVLFGKDSHGCAPGERSDFQIKPAGSQGTGRMPSVTLVLEVDGTATTLKKVYRERWEKQRGSAEARFSGNMTDYFVDGVPKRESDYKAYVSALLPEEKWRLLTDVHWFCRDMPWRERRALLFDLCEVRSEEALLAERPEFAPLLAELGAHTLEECRIRLKAERVKAGKALEALPIRIDECAKTVSGFAGLDFERLREEFTQKNAQWEAIQARLTDLLHNTALEKAVMRQTAASQALAVLERENAVHRQAQAAQRETPYRAAQQEKTRLARELEQQEAALRQESAAAAAAKTRLDGYRERWQVIGREVWSGSTVCPSCGQTLPAHRLAAVRQAFAAEQAARQKQVADDAALLKADCEARSCRMEALAKETAALRERLAEASAQLAGTTPPEAAAVSGLPGYAEKKAEASRELAEAEAELQTLRTGQYAAEAELRRQAAQLAADLEELRTQLAKERLLADAHTRMAQYEGERQAAEAEVERIDRLLYLSEEFTRYKAERITGAVNALFDTVRFRLFSRQVNGSLAECCDPMLDGRPYGTLSEGEKIRLGLDAINGLSRACGLSVPLFLNGAESVTGLPVLRTQSIRMVVREGEKELRYA